MFTKYGSDGSGVSLLHGVKLPSNKHQGPYAGALVLTKLLW